MRRNKLRSKLRTELTKSVEFEICQGMQTRFIRTRYNLSDCHHTTQQISEENCHLKSFSDRFYQICGYGYGYVVGSDFGETETDILDVSGFGFPFRVFSFVFF